MHTFTFSDEAWQDFVTYYNEQVKTADSFHGVALEEFRDKIDHLVWCISQFQNEVAALTLELNYVRRTGRSSDGTQHFISKYAPPKGWIAIPKEPKWPPYWVIIDPATALYLRNGGWGDILSATEFDNLEVVTRVARTRGGEVIQRPSRMEKQYRQLIDLVSSWTLPE